MTYDELRSIFEQAYGSSPYEKYQQAYEGYYQYKPGQSHAERLARSIAEIKEYWLAECFKRCLLVEDALDFRQAYTQEHSVGHRTLTTFKCDNQYVSQAAIAHHKGKLYALFWWNREYVLRPDTKALVVYQPA